MFQRIIFLVAAVLLMALPVQAMSVTSVGKPIYLSRDGETATSGDIKFVTNDGVMKMLSKDGTADYLSFINCDGITGETIDYAIRDVYTSNPTLHLWEITATVGAHGKNCGYWLVGKTGEGQYTAYVSHVSFMNVGYTANEWHQIRSELSNGLLLVTSSHAYLPPGKQFEYEAVNVDDFRVQIFWDDESHWFGVRKIF